MMYLFSRRLSRRGFTLIELLVVIGIILLLMSLAVPAFRASIAQQAPRTEAENFVGLLRSARQFAIVNNTRTRVVFADQAAADATQGTLNLEPLRAYRAFRFFKPQVPPTGEQTSIISAASVERVSKPLRAIPPGFVGQWLPMRNNSRWHIINPAVDLESDFFAAPTTFGASSEDELLEFFMYYRPNIVWDPLNWRLIQRANLLGQFPRNYHQTPLASPYPLLVFNQLPDDQVLLGNELLEFRTMWANAGIGENGQPVDRQWRFFDVPDGDKMALGFPDDRPAAQREFFNLRGIEFNSTGRPTFTSTSATGLRVQSISYDFRFVQATNPANVVTVRISNIDGIPVIIND